MTIENIPRTNFHYIEPFSNKPSFDDWSSQNGLINKSLMDKAAQEIKHFGINSFFFGKIRPYDIEVIGTNYREGLLGKGLNSRQRAVLELLSLECNYNLCKNKKIYAPEAITNFALELRYRFPFFIGSEYSSSPYSADKYYPIQIQDLQNLNLNSSVFDFFLSCDVLEHVPDIEKSLYEIFRILRPGGCMLSTHPFTWQEFSICKAELISGEIIHHMEPEYHGNPVDSNGSLVFTIPGWDIIDLCKKVGFSKSELVFIASTTLGILGSGPPFIPVLRAYR